MFESPPVVGGEVFKGTDGEEQEEFEDCVSGILRACDVERGDESFDVWRDSEVVCELFEFIGAIIY